MALDLRTFLADHGDAVWTLPAGLSRRYELTALQHALDARGEYPILFAPQTRGAGGEGAPIPVVTNLTASRVLVARALGIPDHRQTAEWYARRSAAGIEPRIVGRSQAPVQQVVLTGADADLARIPALTQHELEPGPYLTAAHATTWDPDTGIDNTAIQRCWLRGPRRMSWFPYPTSHNAHNLRKFWGRGEACPVAFWIGHHPAVLMGTQAKLRYPQSHWHAAGGVLGEPLALVPSITHGERVLVPADAEIVIEGFAPRDTVAADGPFGEYTAYLGPQTPAPVCDVTCITLRRDAIYHDYGSGLTDMLVPDNMAMEGRLYELVKAVAPSLRNVHVPAAGRRFHAWLQLAGPARGEARDALVAALAYRRTKWAVAVDEDIDIFSREAIDWALATRVQWSRDAIMIDDLSGSSLDPSLARGATTASKMGVDATLPPRPAPGTPRPVPPVATVPAEALARAGALRAAADPGAWPRE
ncbi:MAG: UbiD family decarboxylase [Gammaproteobacteria bacterium]|nr:UbiD family decarboxylase [Gammaproteobacteria bacterium]